MHPVEGECPLRRNLRRPNFFCGAEFVRREYVYRRVSHACEGVRVITMPAGSAGGLVFGMSLERGARGYHLSIACLSWLGSAPSSADVPRLQALLHSSHLYHEAKSNMSKYGVIADNVKIDVSAMMASPEHAIEQDVRAGFGAATAEPGQSRDARPLPLSALQEQKSKAVSGLTKGIEGLFKKNKARALPPSSHARSRQHPRGSHRLSAVGRGHGPSSRAAVLNQRSLLNRRPPSSAPSVQVNYIKGAGKLLGNGVAEVTLADGSKHQVKAKNIILATGSEVTPLPGVPIDEKRIVSSTGAIALTGAGRSAD